MQQVKLRYHVIARCALKIYYMFSTPRLSLSQNTYFLPYWYKINQFGLKQSILCEIHDPVCLGDVIGVDCLGTGFTPGQKRPPKAKSSIVENHVLTRPHQGNIQSLQFLFIL